MATWWLFLLPVLCSLTLVTGQQVVVGDLVTHFHLVSGKVFAISPNQLRITNFNYDGTGPAAYFWVGVRGKAGDKPDKAGTAVLDEFNRSSRLGKYSNADIVITLPNNLKVWNIKWLSVWCTAFRISFGDVDFTQFRGNLCRWGIPAAC